MAFTAAIHHRWAPWAKAGPECRFGISQATSASSSMHPPSSLCLKIFHMELFKPGAATADWSTPGCPTYRHQLNWKIPPSMFSKNVSNKKVIFHSPKTTKYVCFHHPNMVLLRSIHIPRFLTLETVLHWQNSNMVLGSPLQSGFSPAKSTKYNIIKILKHPVSECSWIWGVSWHDVLFQWAKFATWMRTHCW